MKLEGDNDDYKAGVTDVKTQSGRYLIARRTLAVLLESDRFLSPHV
jgi:hypothetical protein